MESNGSDESLNDSIVYIGTEMIERPATQAKQEETEGVDDLGLLLYVIFLILICKFIFHILCII